MTQMLLGECGGGQRVGRLAQLPRHVPQRPLALPQGGGARPVHGLEAPEVAREPLERGLLLALLGHPLLHLRLRPGPLHSAVVLLGGQSVLETRELHRQAAHVALGLRLQVAVARTQGGMLLRPSGAVLPPSLDFPSQGGAQLLGFRLHRKFALGLLLAVALHLSHEFLLDGLHKVLRLLGKVPQLLVLPLEHPEVFLHGLELRPNLLRLGRPLALDAALPAARILSQRR
mmetsp:Transcript_4153/g.15519  ORF Transcript_4153/g.15519 Transcript_4153/m.15519 type:complete len:230 (-) Transcript_4153:535-1224(-)